MPSRWDRLGNSLLQSFIEYETPRLVKVHNVYLGLVIRVCQILVFSYVISYAILYERGYQVSKHSPILWMNLEVAISI